MSIFHLPPSAQLVDDDYDTGQEPTTKSLRRGLLIAINTIIAATALIIVSI